MKKDLLFISIIIFITIIHCIDCRPRRDEDFDESGQPRRRLVSVTVRAVIEAMDDVGGKGKINYN